MIPSKKLSLPIVLTCLFIFALLMTPNSGYCEDEQQVTASGSAEHSGTAEVEGEFEPSEMIAHHIGDDYQFHIVGDLHLPLPVILYSKENGLSVFLSSRFHGPDHASVPYSGYIYEEGHIAREDGAAFYNLSVTKNVFSMFLVVILMIALFIPAANAYKNRAGQAPKGLQSFLEPIILFVRDQVVKPLIGEKKYRKYLPYMLSLFFFIWLNNLFGLIPIFPGSANVTGNIAVTMTLAVLSLLLITFGGNKHYWSHLLWPPGMPWPVKLLLAPIEVMGAFIVKPGALMIRLFANMLAGHIVLLSIVSLVFILGPKVGSAGTLGVGAGVVAFTIFMYLIKLFVCALQAYIFTFLTCLFIGEAVAEPVHHH